MTQIPHSEVWDTSVCFMLKGVTDGQSFPVTSTEAERIHAILGSESDEPAGRKQFLVFGTINGWTVVIRLAMVEAIRILVDPIDTGPSYEAAEPLAMSVQFGGAHDTLNLSPSNPEEVEALLVELDDTLDMPQRRFVAVRDEDGEWLHIGVEHIRVLLIGPNLLPNRPEAGPSADDLGL